MGDSFEGLAVATYFTRIGKIYVMNWPSMYSAYNACRCSWGLGLFY